MTYAVDVTALNKPFGARDVFEGRALRVERGETVAILGASGCGKSTLLRCVGGIVAPDAGAVAVSGEIGFVFQEPRSMPRLTVEKNVAFAARGDVERARVKDALDLVGLAHAAHSSRRRFRAARRNARRSHARSYAVRRFSYSTDRSARSTFLRLELQTAIARIVRETGRTAILVTHDVDEALYLADRIVVLAGMPARAAIEVVVPLGVLAATPAPLEFKRGGLRLAT